MSNIFDNPSHCKLLEIPNIYFQVLSSQRNDTPLIHIVPLVYIWEVVVSAAVTDFSIKNNLVISYTIKRPI